MGESAIDALVTELIHGRITRRQFVGRAVALGVSASGVAVLLDACGAASSSPTPTAVAPAANQTITIGQALDNYVATGLKSYIGAYPVNANIYEQLVRLNPDYSVSPWLAKSWTQNGNTVRFQLRSDVKFQDGSPLTATDVKYTFDRVAQGGGGLPMLGPNSTVIVDQYTLDVTPTATNYRLVEQIVHPEYAILKSGTVFGDPKNGTGPMIFGEYVKGDHITVTRNPGYWGPKPTATTITHKFIPDATSRTLALQGGQLDLAVDVARSAVAGLRSTPSLKVATAPVGQYQAFYINIHGTAPHDLGQDPAIRQAIETAIDRKGYINTVLAGLGEEVQTFLPPSILGSYASLVKGFSYDVSGAKSALDTAGWSVGSDGIRTKGGRRLSLTMVNGFPDAPTNQGAPEFVQAQLKAVGIDLQITTAPDSASYTSYLTQGAGDLFLETGNQNDGNAAFLPTIIFYRGQTFGNYPKYFGPGGAVDTDIAAALSAPSDSAAAQNVAMAMHEVVDNSKVFVQLAGLSRIYGLHSDIAGFVPHASNVNQNWATVYRTK
ncbi:MAG: ABC transporter substrate-binding protein [Candidatus Dormibacteraeota bacterium]|nr:ABC transporter substrate-binding protein [Candidatus Dormibacteraeota bacterium]